MKEFFEKLKNKIKFVSLIIQNFIQNQWAKLVGWIQKIFSYLINRLLHFKEYILTDRKRIILFILFFPLAASLGTTGYFLFRKHYKVHSSILSGLGMVPSNAEIYLEIKNTKSFKEKLGKAKFFSEIENSEAWQKFISSLALKKFGELFYIIELKSNSILSLTDFVELFADSIGYAAFTDETYLVLAKTNLKSKLGLTLLESFKAGNIPLKEIKEKKEEKKDGEKKEPNSETQEANADNPPAEEGYEQPAGEHVVSDDSYEQSYLEQGIKNGNLVISVMNGNSGEIYFVLIDDYLILSNSQERLTQSLLAATNPSKNSVRSKKEMDLVFREYYKEDVLGISYFNLVGTNFTPFLKPISEDSESISLLFKTEKDLLSADILVTDRKPKNNSNPISLDKIQSSIPNDVLFAIYSNSIGMKEYFNSILNPGEAWSELTKTAPVFLKNGNIAEEGFFPANTSSALLIHKPSIQGEENFLYPDFTIGYVAAKKDETFLKSIFKSGKPKKEKHLGISIKTFQKDGNIFSPSYFEANNMEWVSSNFENAKDCISAANGNKPTIGDLNSSKLESPWKESPHHIVLNWQRMKEDIGTIFLYGSKKTSLYTEKTIEQDINPLLTPFDWIESIHISLGAKGAIYGKMKLSAM